MISSTPTWEHRTFGCFKIHGTVWLSSLIQYKCHESTTYFSSASTTFLFGIKNLHFKNIISNLWNLHVVLDLNPNYCRPLNTKWYVISHPEPCRDFDLTHSCMLRGAHSCLRSALALGLYNKKVIKTRSRWWVPGLLRSRWPECVKFVISLPRVHRGIPLSIVLSTTRQQSLLTCLHYCISRLYGKLQRSKRRRSTTCRISSIYIYYTNKFWRLFT